MAHKHAINSPMNTDIFVVHCLMAKTDACRCHALHKVACRPLWTNHPKTMCCSCVILLQVRRCNMLRPQKAGHVLGRDNQQGKKFTSTMPQEAHSTLTRGEMARPWKMLPLG